MLKCFRSVALALLLSVGGVSVGKAESFTCANLKTDSEAVICRSPSEYLPFLLQSYEFIVQNIRNITILPHACLSYEVDKLSNSEVEWTLREVHNSECGGDTSTAPKIAWLKTIAGKIDDELSLEIYDMNCGCYVMVTT